MPPTPPLHLASPKPSPPYHHLHPPPRHPHHNHPDPDPGPGTGTGPGFRRKESLLRPHRRTNPLIWCAAILCVIFSLLLILAGVLTLIIFLVVKPHTPSFEIAAASLNAIYLDSPTFFNGDFTFLANFSNPNTKIDLAYDSLSVELFYKDRLVAAQGLGRFVQRRMESRLETVHMISSEVFLPVEIAVQMQKELRTSRIVYSVRGNFKVRASIGGLAHVSYWLYGRCLIELTAPPGGVLVARSCRTKR